MVATSFTGHGPTDPVDGPEDGTDHDPGPAYQEALRGQLLKQAYLLINGDRQDQYGDALDTHERIAIMWSALLGDRPDTEITPSDVALMMICVKLVRAMRTPEKADSWIDIAGYAALGGEMADAG